MKNYSIKFINSRKSDFESLHLRRGDLYAYTKNWTYAIHAYSQALSINPASIAAYDGLSRAFHACAQHKEGIKYKQSADKLRKAQSNKHIHKRSTKELLKKLKLSVEAMFSKPFPERAPTLESEMLLKLEKRKTLQAANEKIKRERIEVNIRPTFSSTSIQTCH